MPLEMNNKYSWDEEKRWKNINERNLDIAALGPLVLSDPNVVIEPDNRQDYGEARLIAYGIADGLRLCLCFTRREDKVHLITVFRMHEKQWGKHYGKNSDHDCKRNL